MRRDRIIRRGCPSAPLFKILQNFLSWIFHPALAGLLVRTCETGGWKWSISRGRAQKWSEHLWEGWDHSSLILTGTRGACDWGNMEENLAASFLEWAETETGMDVAPATWNCPVCTPPTLMRFCDCTFRILDPGWSDGLELGLWSIGSAYWIGS